MKRLVFNDKVEYLVQLIDIYSALFIRDTTLWLADQEKQYLAMMVIANSEGIDIDSSEAIRYITALGFKGNAYMYKKKVINKNWIVKTKHGSFLPPAFDYRSKDFKEKINFKFEVAYEHAVGRDATSDSKADSGEIQLDRTAGERSA